MIISLDYDDTFTRDPEAWHQFILIMKNRGHKVYGVTMRKPEECQSMHKDYVNNVHRLFFTSREAKRPFLDSKGITIDVWVDDNPIFVEVDAR